MPTEKAIKSPEELYQLFTDYKGWVLNNPYLVHDFVGKDAVEVWRQKQRPTSWTGFEAWLSRNGIVVHLGHYEQNSREAYTEYLPVIARIKRECTGEILDGALTGIYKDNLAARIEGLADKKEVDKKVTNIKFTDAG